MVIINMNTSVQQGKTKMERLETRIPAEQKAIITHAATLQGRSITDFVVTSAYDAAREAIKEHETIVLSKRDTEIFVEMLLNPPEPNEALKKASKKHKETVKQK